MSITLAELDVVIVTIEYGDIQFENEKYITSEVISDNSISPEDVEEFLRTSLHVKLGDDYFEAIDWNSLHIERWT